MQRRNQSRVWAKELAALGFGKIVFVFHGSVPSRRHGIFWRD
jgi:hypothetical protein